MVEMLCPRCSAPVQAPTLLQHQYRCPQHGEVAGVLPAKDFHPQHVADLARRSEVPVWYPQPMPPDWVFSGLCWAETPRRRSPAVAIAVSGKGLSDGPTDVVIVAEQPGCGLGAGYAGLPWLDPGTDAFNGPPAVRIRTGDTVTALWSLATAGDRVAFVGEAEGSWLWIVGWPSSAWGMVDDGLRLADARRDGSYSQFPSGARNPRLGRR